MPLPVAPGNYPTYDFVSNALTLVAGISDPGRSFTGKERWFER